ncbi:MAG: apolipoprotein N-acyltransferase [Polyangiales bacterium]
MAGPASRLPVPPPAYVFAAASGLALAFAAAPFDLPVLAFASAPFFQRAIELRAGTSRAPWHGVRVGLVAGVAVHLVAFYWAVPLFTVNVHLAWPLAVLLAAALWIAQSLPFVVAGALADGLASLGIRPFAIVPIALVVAFSRAWMLFPFRPSSPLVELLPWVQLADVGGGPLLDLALGLSGCALLEGWRVRSRALVALGLGACLGPLAYGLPRLEAIREASRHAPTTRVAVVQPSVLQGLKFDASRAAEQLGALRRMTAEVERERPDFVVWPETSYPYMLSRRARRDPSGRFGLRTTGEVHAPILFGTLAWGRGCDHRNSVAAMDSEGRIVGWADKVHPLPFSERIPLWEHLPFLHGFAPCPGYVTGQGAQVVAFEGRRIGVLNCYEDILDAYVREVGAARIDFLVNVTNDAWFLDTSEPHLHHMAARLRAVETRRELVRAVNTGVSGHIDATGARRIETATFVPRTFVAEVRSLDVETVWVRHGDLLTPALEGLLLALIGLAWTRRTGGTRRR